MGSHESTSKTPSAISMSCEPVFKTWLPWSLVVVLAAFVAWLLFSSTERMKKPSSQLSTETLQVKAESTRLQGWPDGKSAVELLGYENVHAYRWSGGMLTGWVEFDDGSKPRRVAIDLNEQLANEGKLDPKAFSGQIVIARRKAADPMDAQECWIWVRVLKDVTEKGKEGSKDPSNDRKWVESTTAAYHGPWKARGGIEGSSGPDGTRFSLHSMKPGDTFRDSASKWLEVRVKND